MTTTDPRPAPLPAADERAARPELVAALRSAVDGDVHDDDLNRGQYSTDASNYRVVPDVVVVPRDVDGARAAIDTARRLGAPLTSRGGGTSIAGNSVGTGVIVDFSRHVNRILEIDPEARTARVEPGVIMSDLQRAAAPHGLRFGPDPSTLNRATFGGMIGNNACGPRAVAFGRTSDNVISLDVVDGQGREYTAGAGKGALDVVPGLGELVRADLATIRTELGRFKRQVSGYSLEHLLPENGTDLAKMLVGTEGTLATTLGATVNLVEIPGAPVLVALGYPDMASAADVVPGLLAHQPIAIEGIDARLVDVVRRHIGPAAVPELPAGNGWLLVEVGGSDAAEALARAESLAKDAGTDAVMIRSAGPEASALWRIRADGAGLGGRTPSGAQGWPGWEDAAVPPEKLGAYLRDFEALMAGHGVDGLLYGHFGDGCMHVRIDLPLDTPAGVPAARRFLEESADLVASYGGSLSGEHGDGRARSELLDRMYTPAAIDLFGKVKGLFDPQESLNPGILVRPVSMTDDLRRPYAKKLLPIAGGFSFHKDGGDFTTAVHRCTGVGKCRADSSDSGGFMCPSYQATRDETDVTRGRSRILQELTNGSLIHDVRSPAVHDSLDLCLSCKACGRDCPAGVDMATLKAEVLHRSYKGRLRPMNHYALGWLPRWANLITRVPAITRLVNAVLAVRPVAKLVMTGGGMDTRRQMVRFSTERFSRWVRSRSGVTVGDAPAAPVTDRTVVLWADSFSESLDGNGAQAMVSVLQEAGYVVVVPQDRACCGLTWISTGQLDGARRQLEQTMSVLAPYVEAGIPIIGVEPSCTGVLRSDLVDLFPDDPRATAIAEGTYTLAELLTAPEPLGPGERWQPPSLEGVEVVAQPHCHHYSVMGWDADAALLAKSGATVNQLAGCCGLAGNFGMEKGHYDVSVKVAENALLPALREAGPQAVYLADGYSCRTQAEQLVGRGGVHLAQLLSGDR
ncbi:FAD-binding and (Fe-S)-binding domain-containing protein [Georgenia sunbinii]|uniref:FAD-binding and (Fe-S)-binding domain-containing protein n=1 Tax=Georgenia sunbinii TaxID=3117728 RepID=UPI003D9C244C